MLSRANPLLAAQEVLYIGEAFGTDGSSNVWRRVQAHAKLQRIYEDHADIDCDIFVAPLSLERRAWTSDDHIDDDEHGPDFDKYYEYFASPEGNIRKPSVDLVEHSLISYFSPHYNEKLKEWRQEAPTQSMQLMRNAGFRLIQVHLSGWWGLARFYSEMVSSKVRSHFISRDIPKGRGQPAFRGIAAERISEWRHEAMMIRDGQKLLEESAGRTGTTIRVFGQQAPMLRTPPGVDLPTVTPGEGGTNQSQAALRSKIAEKREGCRQVEALIPHSGESSYDPKTGSIVIAQFSDGTVQRVNLHDPSSGRATSMIVFGNRQSGRSNHLRVVMFEAAMTGLFVSAVANVKSTKILREIFQDDQEVELYDEGIDGAIKLLRVMIRIIDHRLTERIYTTPSKDAPAILFAIDDADELLHTEQASSLVQKILADGGQTGVGVLLVWRPSAI